MDILVVGDCHGWKPEIDDEAENADVIIATGDICGDSDEMRSAMFESIDTQKHWYDILGRERARKAVEKSLEEGEKVLEYLNSFGKPVFVVPGNWDWIGEEDGWNFLHKNRFQEIIDDLENVCNINMERYEDSVFSYIGYGPCSGPEIPQYEDDKPESEEEMERIREEYSRDKEKINELVEEANNPVILLSHNVPHKTDLDKIRNEESPAFGRHYGSIIVKEVLEEKEVHLSVAGHMHEGYGSEEVEDTLAINAGLHSYVKLAIDSSGVKNVVFKPPVDEY